MRNDTNLAVQPQKMPRDLDSREIVLSTIVCSENEGADNLVFAYMQKSCFLITRHFFGVYAFVEAKKVL